MAASVGHLRLRLESEYIAYVVMKQTLREIRDEPWLDGAEAKERAEVALKAVAELTGEKDDEP